MNYDIPFGADVFRLDLCRPTDDSGVGESLEGMSAVSSGGVRNNPYKPPANVRFEGEDNSNLEVADLEELEDTVHPLPGDAEYLRRKAMGAHFLAGVTPQQVAHLSPQLKASMENFMNQLEQYVSCLTMPSSDNQSLLIRAVRLRAWVPLGCAGVECKCQSLMLFPYLVVEIVITGTM